METYLLKKYREAARILPAHIYEAAAALPESEQLCAEEFRLRRGKAPAIVLPDGEKTLRCASLSREDLVSVLEKATDASVHSVQGSIREGFITVAGGHRIGLCGSAASSGAEMRGFREISSLNIRIAKEIKTAAENVVGSVWSAGKVCSTLIVSPPGGGKTTLLRDLVRRVSNRGIRCCIADERGEIAAGAGLDVGRCTDVLDSAPRAKAAILMLRSMSPQVMVMDEITAPEDAQALLLSADCGVKMFATAHASGAEELKKRAVYCVLLEKHVFERLVFISRSGRERKYEIMDGESLC